MKSLAFLLLTRIAAPRATVSRRTDVAVAAFALLCVFYGLWPIWRAFFPLEIDLKEPWNAYHADAVAQHGVLYPDLAELVANNYPPLWYYLTGAISWLGLDPVYAGRALSFAAVVALAVLIGLTICRFSAGWSGAMAGGLVFFGTMVRYADWYVAMNDPHLPALALMMAALLWFLARGPSRGAEWPLLLMVVAGFFKQALVAIPAMALFLLASQNFKLAARAAVIAGCGALAALAILTAIYGKPFFDEIFFYPREISFDRALNSVARLGAIAPALALWAVWVCCDYRSEAARFSITFVAFAFGGYLLQKIGAGVDVNAAFELYVAVAVGIGLAFDRIATMPMFLGMGVESRRLIIMAGLVLGLIAAPGLEPYYLVASPEYRALFSSNADVMRAEVRRIAAIPGAVHCSIDTVCRAAGKPFAVDVFFIGQRGVTGHLTPNELHGRLVAKGIHYETIDPRASVRPLQRQLFYGRAQ